MARQTLILAKSITEANAYAKLAGLPRFTYRPVRSSGAIRGVRNAEVHVLPSFLTRPDRHAIVSALRTARALEIFYVDPADFEDSNALETEGPTERQLEVAYRYNAIREATRAEALVAFAESELVGVVTNGKHETAESLTEATEAEIAEVIEAKPAPKPRKPRAPKAAPPADFF